MQVAIHTCDYEALELDSLVSSSFNIVTSIGPNTSLPKSKVDEVRESCQLGKQTKDAFPKDRNVNLNSGALRCVSECQLRWHPLHESVAKSVEQKGGKFMKPPFCTT